MEEAQIPKVDRGVMLIGQLILLPCTFFLTTCISYFIGSAGELAKVAEPLAYSLNLLKNPFQLCFLLKAFITSDMQAEQYNQVWNMLPLKPEERYQLLWQGM